MIRRATREDIPRIVEMATECHAWLNLKNKVGADPARIFDLASLFIASPEHLLLLSEKEEQVVGVIALGVVTHVFSGEKVGTELLWWVEPEARSNGTALELLEAGEAWAAAQGAERIEMISPYGSTLEKLYQRRGYTPLETVHQLGLR